jgi:hypothetical protein
MLAGLTVAAALVALVKGKSNRVSL